MCLKTNRRTPVPCYSWFPWEPWAVKWSRTWSRPFMAPLWIHFNPSGHFHLGVFTFDASGLDFNGCGLVYSGAKIYLVNFVQILIYIEYILNFPKYLDNRDQILIFPAIFWGKCKCTLYINYTLLYIILFYIYFLSTCQDFMVFPEKL